MNTEIVSDPVPLFAGVKDSGSGRKVGRHGMKNPRPPRHIIISSDTFQSRQTDHALLDNHAWRSRYPPNALVISIRYTLASLRASL